MVIFSGDCGKLQSNDVTSAKFHFNFYNIMLLHFNYGYLYIKLLVASTSIFFFFLIAQERFFSIYRDSWIHFHEKLLEHILCLHICADINSYKQ